MISRRDLARRAVRGAARGSSVTYALIALCCLLFLISPVSGLNPAYGVGDQVLSAQAAYFERWGVVPAELMSGAPGALLTPLTALFVHGSWLHLLGNMLFLYVFGAMTEERMGRFAFAVFYLATGYAALLAYAVANADSDQTLVGASGAISAVLGAFLRLFPRARVTSLFPFLFFLPLRFPAWAVLVFWFVLQWVAAHNAGSGPGVAYLAHLAGFTAGFLYAWVRYRGGSRVGAPATAAASEGDSKP